MKLIVIPFVIGTLGTDTGGVGNKRASGDHPNYNIFETGQHIKN